MLYDRGIVRDRDDGRLNVVTSTLDNVTTGEDLSSLLLDLDKTINEAFDSLFGVKRSN